MSLHVLECQTARGLTLTTITTTSEERSKVPTNDL